MNQCPACDGENLTRYERIGHAVNLAGTKFTYQNVYFICSTCSEELTGLEDDDNYIRALIASEEE